MLQFASCLHGKLLVVKAFQSSGNIRWLELHADRAGSRNVLLCAGNGLGFLLILMDIWLFHFSPKHIIQLVPAVFPALLWIFG